MIRIHRDPDGEWWIAAGELDLPGAKKQMHSYGYNAYRFADLDEMPDEIAKKLSSLLHLIPGVEPTTIAGVGRRVSQNTFWVFTEDKTC